MDNIINEYAEQYKKENNDKINKTISNLSAIYNNKYKQK